MPEIFKERPHENEKKSALSYVSQLLEEARNDKENRGEAISNLEEVQRLLNSKKYGLVWERHNEIVEEEMKDKIPIFIEDDSKKINDNPNSEDFNFILEGDNLHSLHLLEKTHTGKIDVIYIDPPYNTGKKDFTYNDLTVALEDDFRHSKWLSFMERRLRIAKNLLSESGVIFVQIDDNEQAHLKLLMDNIFGEQNFISTIIQNKQNAKNDAVNVQKNHEYILVYRLRTILLGSKIKPNLIKKEVVEREVFEENGKFYLINDSITTRGEGGVLNARQNLGYTVYFNPKTSEKIGIVDYDIKLAKTSNEMTIYSDREDLISQGFIPIRPPRVRGKLGAWTWGIEKFNSESDHIIITGKNKKYAVKKRTFVDRLDVFQSGDKYFYKKEVLSNSKSIIGFSTNEGSTSLSDIMGGKTVFTNPKNVEMVKYLINLVPKKDATILDFFAGSGTTGQAVTELNVEDNGTRKFILATNNENNIAEEVTYERMKRVSSGTKKYEANPLNLKYFKTDFVEKTDEDLEFTLLANLTALVELTRGVDLSNSDIAIITRRSDLDNLDFSNLSMIYMRSQTHKMLDRAGLILLKNIKIIDIPETFFPKEMREVGL